LSDIAKDAHTSVSTVSRVLAGGNAARRISAPTTQRVMDAARRLGYRPNLLARSLRTRRSHTVALMVSDIANPWFGALASLIEQALHRQGYSLVLCNSAEDVVLENEYLQLLPQKGIDGLILVPLLRSKQALDEQLPAGLPTVILDRPLGGHSASVSTDQDELTTRLCDALAKAGVKRVAVVAGPEHVSTHQRRAEVIASRFEVVASIRGPARQETGRAAIVKFAGMSFEAVVATNNFLGIGVLDAMISVDHACVLGCFDDIPLMHLLPVPIVCANQDVEKLAEATVKMLVRQLDGSKDVIEPVVIPSTIVTNGAFSKRVDPR